ncbi:NUDIX hydrolase [Kaistia sp. 32K]|uniref:NUDIX domain-containing protein n=1 Tax=Kaistia sp. 32K TaxID=2795690 RepID=UPI0019164F0E|nr:NUDIX domain-containing protein [Kaistia sp. 32K]BCP54683.1 NUDIX hydrolase [Kaistia sp. 32K]
MYSFLARLGGLAAPVLRGMTLGVRGACFDADGRVFLVRHSYTPGWYLPGGGVERGESAAEALARELREEGGIILGASPSLFGIYVNPKRRRDHVVVFVSYDFDRPAPPAYPNREIAEAGFFDPGALPEATTPATRRRLGEILDRVPASAHW